MAKLGYTFYPKDWGNSEHVFELNLSERGLYREFIDLAMLNDNKTEIKKEIWIRKFAVTKEDLEVILNKLLSLNLIEYKKDILFIPSCETRLNLVRGGKKGGEKNKPTPKPFVSLPQSLLENNHKPTPKQIEIETKTEYNSNNTHEKFLIRCLESEEWKIAIESREKIPMDKIPLALKDFNGNLLTTGEFKQNLGDYKYHFVSWARKLKAIKS